jgi:hypothetical protein
MLSIKDQLTGTIVEGLAKAAPFLVYRTGRLIENAMVKYGQTY